MDNLPEQYTQYFRLFSESGGILAERYIVCNGQDDAVDICNNMVRDWNRRHSQLKAARCTSDTADEGIMRVSLLNMY